jgi:hypothetical protein
MSPMGMDNTRWLAKTRFTSTAQASSRDQNLQIERGSQRKHSALSIHSGKTFFVQFRETEESPKRRPGQGTLNTKSNVSVQFIFYPCLCVTFCFVSSSVCHPGAERRRHQERAASSWRNREERSTTSCIWGQQLIRIFSANLSILLRYAYSKNGRPFQTGLVIRC